jgi:hypothetical protein
MVRKTAGWFSLMLLLAAAPKAQAADVKSILLVTEGNGLLEMAVKASHDGRTTLLTPAQYENNRPGGFDVVIFDRHQPAHIPARGGLIYFGVAPAGTKLKTATKDGRPVLTKNVIVTQWDGDHAITAGVNFSDKLFIQEAVKLELAEPGSKALITGTDGPLVVLYGEAGRRHLVVAFDVAKSNWPLKAVFPVFIFRALTEMAK